MGNGPLDRIKHREVRFRSPHPDPDQARTAVLLLSGVDGIISVRRVEQDCIHISYDIAGICLQMIEDALIELDFHLDNSLLTKLKRALYYYTEETERANLGCERNTPCCTQQVFINRYQRLPHGCRDGRPEHWRKYL